jgi:hypothetical protein
MVFYSSIRGNMKCFFFSLWMLVLIHSAYGQKNWTPLFDGKTLDGWKQYGGKAHFNVYKESILAITAPNTPNSFFCTQAEYGDFVLEMDIMISDSNTTAGIQFRSHYDPSGNNGAGKVYGYQMVLDPTAQHGTGGIYDEGRREWLYPLSMNPKAAKPLKLMDINKIRIECLGNETRTWVNGVAAADLVDMTDYNGFIALAVHSVPKVGMAGGTVIFRNIRIKSITKFSSDPPVGTYVMNTIPNFLTDFEIKSGWKLLFDGETSNGWRGAYLDGFPAKGWQVEDGKMNVISSEGHESAGGGDIVTQGQFKAFDLSFEFQMTPGANSGVKYFVTLKEKNEGSAIGLEYQILDDSLHPDAKLGRDGDRTLASLYDLITAAKPNRIIRPIGKWNTGRIIVYPNNLVEHYLNGVKVLEYYRGSAAFRDLVAVSKFKIWPGFGEAPEGHILLQEHGSEVSFRSIKIRILEEPGKKD